MKKIKYSVFCTLLLFILSELALGAGMLTSDKEATATRMKRHYKIDFPKTIIRHLNNHKDASIIEFSGKNKAWLKVEGAYIIKDGKPVRLNNHPGLEHIIRKLGKLIGTGCNTAELKYQATWGCSSTGHVYYLLNEVYPADTDFQSLYPEMSIRSVKTVSTFANERHVTGELFSLEFWEVGNSLTVYFFHLGLENYSLIFDSFMITLPKSLLIALIQNFESISSEKNFALSLHQSTIKPSDLSELSEPTKPNEFFKFSKLSELPKPESTELSELPKPESTELPKPESTELSVLSEPAEPSWILALAEAYYHFSIDHPYLCLLQKGIVLAGWTTAFVALFPRHRLRFNNIETTGQKPGKHTDNAAGDLFSKKPEDNISPLSPQIGETVMPALAQNQETQTINNVRILTDQGLNNIVTELQTAHRDGVDLASRQVRLLRALRDIVQRLNEDNVSYDLMDIITRNLHVSTNLRKALKVVDSLDFAGDAIPDTLIKKLSKRFR